MLRWPFTLLGKEKKIQNSSNSHQPPPSPSNPRPSLVYIYTYIYIWNSTDGHNVHNNEKKRLEKSPNTHQTPPPHPSNPTLPPPPKIRTENSNTSCVINIYETFFYFYFYFLFLKGMKIRWETPENGYDIYDIRGSVMKLKFRFHPFVFFGGMGALLLNHSSFCFV